MSPAPLPSPQITDSPNVPSDLGLVAQAIENQAVAAYNGYNTANTPSAASLEARVTAIDAQPGGSVSVVDGRITALNASINTWTNGGSSNLSTQVTRTQAFGARQDAHDAAMASLNASLSTYEPQIATLQSQRPGGLLYSSQNSYNVTLSNSVLTVILYQTHTFVSNRYYRVSFTGTAQNTVERDAQNISALWTTNAGTSPSTSTFPWGTSRTSMGATNVSMPFGCFAVITGLSGVYTAALCAYVATSDPGRSKISDTGSFIMEDLGYRYY